jgi:hypothetical protein
MPTERWVAYHKQLKIWLTVKEYNQVKALAQAQGLTLADLLRRRLGLLP